jgi:hypothetical protein
MSNKLSLLPDFPWYTESQGEKYSPSYKSINGGKADSGSNNSDLLLGGLWFDSGPEYCSGSDFPQTL